MGLWVCVLRKGRGGETVYTIRENIECRIWIVGGCGIARVCVATLSHLTAIFGSFSVGGFLRWHFYVFRRFDL